MIVSGGLFAGDRLILEEIEGRFNVSRTVVREAIRSLQAKGLIEARPNVGTCVQPVSRWSLLDPDVIAWRASGLDSDSQCRELVELRGMIETQAVSRIACTDFGKGDRAAALRAAAQGMEAALYDTEESAFTEADAAFHELLVECCGNDMLVHLHKIVSDALMTISAFSAAGCPPSMPTCTRHLAVAEAINQGGDQTERVVPDLLINIRSTEKSMPQHAV